MKFRDNIEDPFLLGESRYRKNRHLESVTSCISCMTVVVDISLQTILGH